MKYAHALSRHIFSSLQVCNHPELFDRGHAMSPFSFARYIHREESLDIHPAGFVECVYRGDDNPMSMAIPRLVFATGMFVITFARRLING
jgi:hypothetical protein